MLRFLWAVSTMNTYHVARNGKKYQVIETLPGKGTFQVVGFPTELDARAWLVNYLRMLGPMRSSPTSDPKRQVAIGSNALLSPRSEIVDRQKVPA